MKRLRGDDVGESFLAQVVHGCLSRGEEQGGGVVREDAVDFLGHAAVEGAQAGFHVGHGDMQFDRGQGSGQGGISVAIHQNPIRLFQEKHLSIFSIIRPVFCP